MKCAVNDHSCKIDILYWKEADVANLPLCRLCKPLLAYYLPKLSYIGQRTTDNVDRCLGKAPLNRLPGKLSAASKRASSMHAQQELRKREEE